MTYSSAQLQELINQFISRLPYSRCPATLYDPIRYTLAAGGKRLRPVLMLMAYNLYKDDPATILPVAAGLETYHNYTLLHDDLMDKSDLRRGRQTVHKKWNENTAILSGDTMMVLAYKYLSCCARRHLPAVLDAFTETAIEIGEGQQYDMDFECRSDVTEDEYIEMIRLKTSVLLACAMQIGGILADVAAAEQERLYAAGENIGIAFQLQDDYLDVYGNEAIFGKPIGGDICNNKKTYMLITACAIAQGADKESLSRWLTAETFDAQEKITAIRAIYDKLNIAQRVTEKIDHYFREAFDNISMLAVDDDRKVALRQYVATLRTRET